MLTISRKINQYLKNGNPVFVYEIDGTKEELAAYKTSQGDYYRESEAKKAMYFSQRPLEAGAELSATRSGRYQVLQDLEMTAAQKESETIIQEAKLEAIRRITGMSKAQMTERLLARF